MIFKKTTDHLYNLDAEAMVLGACLYENNAIAEVIQLVNSGSFYSDKHAKIFNAITTLWQRHEQVDVVTLSDYLRTKGELETVGGEAYIVDLTSKVSSSANVASHCLIVRQKELRRRMISVGNEIVAKVANPTQDEFELLDETLATLNDLRSSLGKQRVKSFFHVAEETTDLLQAIYDNRSIGVVEFKFTDLDNVIGGMMSGNLVVIAAPEKSGKTTLALQIALRNAKTGVPVLIESGEMSRTEIMLRLACLDEGVRWIDVKTRQLHALQWERLFKRIAMYAQLPVYVRSGRITPEEIAADTQMYVKRKGIKLVVLDYIQQVDVSSKSEDTREERLSSFAYQLKEIAKQNEVPLLALSAVNDELKTRGSRGIQYAFDVGIKFQNIKPEMLEPGKTSYLVDFEITQRMGLSGVMGDVRLQYNLVNGAWYNSFDNLVPIQEEIF